MTAILIVLAFFIINAIVGAAVLAGIDKDGRLFEWYSSAPFVVLNVCVLELWPVVWFLYRRSTP